MFWLGFVIGIVVATACALVHRFRREIALKICESTKNKKVKELAEKFLGTSEEKQSTTGKYEKNYWE